MPPIIDQIYRFPVKGLSSEPLDGVDLSPGRPLPHDRRFALTLGSTPKDAAANEWQPKTSFLMLMRNEKLAALETRFDDETETLSVLRGGKQVAKGRLTEPVGRSMIKEFFAAYMGSEARGRPSIVEGADGRTLSDYRDSVVSLINLSSVGDLERVVGCPVHPLRFRGNLYFRSDEPWVEFDWVGREIAIGGARLEVVKRTERCAATNVDPLTAARDLNIPQALKRGFGHIDCGVYATVIEGGPIRIGDVIGVPA